MISDAYLFDDKDSNVVRLRKTDSSFIYLRNGSLPNTYTWNRVENKNIIHSRRFEIDPGNDQENILTKYMNEVDAYGQRLLVLTLSYIVLVTVHPVCGKFHTYKSRAH